MGGSILIVSRQSGLLPRLEERARECGYDPIPAAPADAAQQLRRLHPALILADAAVFDDPESEAVRALVQATRECELIVLAAAGETGPALEAVRLGAGDIIALPFEEDEPDLSLRRAGERLEVRAKIARLRAEAKTPAELFEAPARGTGHQVADLIHRERLHVAEQLTKGLYAGFRRIVGEIQGDGDFYPDIPTYVSIHNMDRKVVATNGLLRERFGERVGSTSWELCSISAPDPESCPINRTFDTGLSQFSPGLIQDTKGRPVSLILYTLPILNDQGEVVLVIGVASDMADAHRLKDRFTEVQESYHHLFDEVPCYITVQDKDFNLVASNRRFKEHFGDELGVPCFKVYKGRDERCQECPVARTFETGASQTSEELIIDRLGREYNVIVKTAPIRNARGEITQVMEMATDITEVKSLQKELLKAEHLYQQLFDEVPCYISVQDRDFVLTATNRRFKEDFGDRTGSYCFQTYKHRDSPCNVCPVAMTFEDGKPHSTEEVVTALDGRKINTLTWTAPLYDDHGEIIQVMEMSTDITRIRQMQDHLTNLGLLIGSISHGVKGLLTGLDGGMYLLTTGFNQKDKKRIDDGWKTVRLMVDRIKSTVLDILYYAKERELNWDKVDVLSLAQRVISAVRPKAEAYGIGFTVEADDSLGQFEVDAGVVTSALVNFLENAVDACVGDKAEKDYRIAFRVSSENDHVSFIIEDNGMGMDQETMNNMFTLFFSSKGSSGTGLGLYIGNEVILQHGGTIDVTSEVGEGTRFHITVPKIFPGNGDKEGG